MSLFKFPRLLVRNEAKLKQLQDRVFEPLFFRLQNIIAVCERRALGVEVRYEANRVAGESVLDQKQIEHTHFIVNSPNVSGDLSPVRSEGIERHFSLVLQPDSQDIRLNIVYPVLVQDARQHLPALMAAWQELEGSFLAFLDAVRGDMGRIAGSLEKKLKVDGSWGHDRPRVYADYPRLALYAFGMAYLTEVNWDIHFNEPNGEVRVDVTTAGMGIADKFAVLRTALEGYCTDTQFLKRHQAQIDAMAKQAVEIREALREALALVPGERPPLEYDASKGELVWADKTVRFYEGTASKVVFDFLVLRRKATQLELGALVGDEPEPVESPMKVKKKKTKEKSKLRSAIKDLNEKFSDHKLPLRVERIGGLYALSETVDLASF